MRDGRQWSPVWWEPGDHRGGVAEAALGETDNSLLTGVFVSNGMSVQSGPARVQAGLDRDDIGGDRADQDRGSDSSENVGGPHAPMQQQHFDELTGAGGVAVDFPCLLPERLVRRGEDSGL